jgi:hypothetical protein
MTTYPRNTGDTAMEVRRLQPGRNVRFVKRLSCEPIDGG